MKVYIVVYSDLGSYTEQGLYNEENYIDNVYSDEDTAENRVNQLQKYSYNAWIDEREVK